MWSILRALKRSWTQHFVSQFSGLVILVLTYSAVLFIALSLTNIKHLFGLWGKVNQVTVYLKNKPAQEDKQQVVNFLNKHEIVESINLVTSKQAAQKFGSQFNGLSSQEIDSSRLSEFFPEFYKVNLVQEKAYKSGSYALDSFASLLKQKFKAVSNVSYGKSWLSRYVIILSNLEKAGWFLILLFQIGSLVVSSNVIKTILFHRKDEIEILEFIGADDLTIYLPQVINVLLVGGLSFISALALNYSAFHFLTHADSLAGSQSLQSSLQFLPLKAVVGVAFLGISSLGLYSIFTIFQMMPRQKKQAIVGEQP